MTRATTCSLECRRTNDSALSLSTENTAARYKTQKKTPRSRVSQDYRYLAEILLDNNFS